MSCSRTQHGGGRSQTPEPLAPESDTLPLSHRAPLNVLNTADAVETLSVKLLTIAVAVATLSVNC